MGLDIRSWNEESLGTVVGFCREREEEVRVGWVWGWWRYGELILNFFGDCCPGRKMDCRGWFWEVSVWFWRSEFRITSRLIGMKFDTQSDSRFRDWSGVDGQVESRGSARGVGWVEMGVRASKWKMTCYSRIRRFLKLIWPWSLYFSALIWDVVSRVCCLMDWIVRILDVVSGSDELCIIPGFIRLRFFTNYCPLWKGKCHIKF